MKDTMRHIVLISGKDSLATAIVQRRREPVLPYEFVFNEVGWELPETIDWLAKVETYLGQPLRRLGDNLTEICLEQNCLPLPQRRFCTKYAKIQPLNDYLGSTPATIYFGLRFDELNRIGYVVPPKQPVVCRYPLRDVRFNLQDVWELCQSVGLLPPAFHWQWIEDRVRELLGRSQSVLDTLSPWERNSLLAWRSRNNCDRCFYSGLYEKIGLWEHYPNLFEDACQLEERLCHRDNHTWNQGFRLRDLPNRAGAIKEARARKVARILMDRQQGLLFADEPDDLTVTSCGLLCGK